MTLDYVYHNFAKENMMTRVPLTDGSGAWFNTDSAIGFTEDTNWDGRNQISVPTGSQWDHEHLYYTANGKWVLNSFSNYQGTRETYEQIDEASAIKWLIQNNKTESNTAFMELPKRIRESIGAGFAAAEI